MAVCWIAFGERMVQTGSMFISTLCSRCYIILSHLKQISCLTCERNPMQHSAFQHNTIAALFPLFAQKRDIQLTNDYNWCFANVMMSMNRHWGFDVLIILFSSWVIPAH